MSKVKYSEFEKQMNSVLKHQDEALTDIHIPSAEKIDLTIAKTEELLRSLGCQPKALKDLAPILQTEKLMVFPTWVELCAVAERHVVMDC